ncbi:MAG: hypothetical protein KDJ33_17540 [Gammaproteobacteria bacterium]|nr:hypothetical protein [Gammaproteobacteria bacterium]
MSEPQVLPLDDFGTPGLAQVIRVLGQLEQPFDFAIESGQILVAAYKGCGRAARF